MPEIRITLPRPHAAQRNILGSARRFNAVVCGRRWGKTVMGIDRLVGPALSGYPVAWFSPTHKMLAEIWRETRRALRPITLSANASDHRIDLSTGGVVEMWSLENYDSVRGRKYKRAVIDEAAMVSNLPDAWQAAIRPTLTDYKGDAWLLSTPKGMGFFHNTFAWGQDPERPEWASWTRPTVSNPFIDPEEVEIAKSELPDRVFRQEYLAEFLEDGGGVFRGVRAAIDASRKENLVAPHTDRRYTLGVDLARINDFTVLTVIDDNGVQVYHERFNQISWERQIAAIVRVALLFGANVVIDSTGVGDPIYEAVRKAGLSVTPFVFSAATKEALIDNLAMRIEQNTARLMDVDVQTTELSAYQYEVTKSRNVRMNAPEGMHDDCVISLALAFWGLSRRRVMSDAW